MKRIKFEFRLAFLYLLLGFLWILLTDILLITFIKDPDVITEFQTFKGLLFVFISAGLLFLYAKQYSSKIRKVEKKHQESEVKFRTLVENANDVIYSLSPEGKFIYISPNWKDLMGYSLAEVKGKSIEKFVHPEDLELCINFLKIAISTGEKQSGVEYRIKHKDGTWLWHSSNGSPIKDEDGNVISIIGISRDITERILKENELKVAVEKAEKANQLKTEFLNNMSHEIRTPMNGIIGFSELLDNPNLSDEERKSYSNIIQSSSHQLLRVIDDILEISTLETKQEKLVETEFCLNCFLEELFSIFNLKAKDSNINLYLKKELSDDQSYIISDKIKLNKILSNLLENALKFTNKGSIEFGYLVKDSNLIFYVKDTGIGILPKNHEIIFERFSQGDKEIKNKYGGLGLGLSICQENVKLLNGSIVLESEKGKGSTFYISIPYKNAQNIKNNTTENIVTSKQTGNAYTILVAEDEDTNFLYLEALLENEIDRDYKLIHAKNGQEAVDKCFENKNIDLVLMDIKMPLMNGYEAIKKIKTKYSNIPIIAQTAYSTESDKQFALKHGCDDFISKPINKNELFQLIDKYVSDK
ncbi:MAG TPA: PAS domain S-box protein [Flavobacteriaceae bacterium]|nr:PAS domain S-box protein [Flavobacteriaceae bacterium]